MLPVTRCAPLVVLILGLMASHGAVFADSRVAPLILRDPPFSFELNEGQAPRGVKFLARTNRYTLLLTSAEAAWVFRGPSPTARSGVWPTVLHMRFVGGRRAPLVFGLEQLAGRSNYFIGSDARNWHRNVPLFSKVVCRGIYPGIDVIYYGNQQDLEYDFVIAPGADPGRIVLQFRGARKLELESDGALLLHLPAASFRFLSPLVYQERAGLRTQVMGRYELRGRSRVGFALGSYDPSLPLVIDPILSYSSFLGAGDVASANAIAVSPSGEMYLAGDTASFAFPDVPNLENIVTQRRVFVAKLNAAGNQLVYFNVFGGSTGIPQARGIALGEDGSAYVTGETDARDFPITSGGFQSFGSACFVTKFSPSGSQIQYSMILASSGCYAIAVDQGGNAFVTGAATSGFPTTPGAFQTVSEGLFNQDAFAAKLNAAGSALVYATFLGGSGIDWGAGLALDSQTNAYVTGFTNSPNFPLQNPIQARPGGVFVSKINPAGSALAYSTYLGGTGIGLDRANAIALDTQGNAYVTGYAMTTDFPVKNALQPKLAGIQDVFITKLDASGSSLVYSTYLGGSHDDVGKGIAVDLGGSVYVAGYTLSADFPTHNPIQRRHGGVGNGLFGDVFQVKLDPAGSTLVYSTFLGGSEGDAANALALDAKGNVYLAGQTYSSDFPTADGRKDFLARGADGFVAKISEDDLPPPVLPPSSVLSAASFQSAAAPGSVASGSLVSIFGSDLAVATQRAPGVPLPQAMLETSVTFNGLPAPLLYVSRSQINAQVPFLLPPGKAVIRVKRGDAVTAEQNLNVTSVAPGIFTVQQQGAAAAATLHASSFRPVSEREPAVPGEVIALFCTGLGALTRPVPSGYPPPAPPPQTVSTPTVMVGGLPAAIIYSGLAPLLVGVYQINFQVPFGVTAGSQPLEIILDGAKSNVAQIAIGSP